MNWKKRSKAFRYWISRNKCILGCPGTYHDETSEWLCDPAHVRTKATVGHKPDVGNIVPLCRVHHRQQSDWGIKLFEMTYSVDLTKKAKAFGQKWTETKGGKG